MGFVVRKLKLCNWRDRKGSLMHREKQWLQLQRGGTNHIIQTLTKRTPYSCNQAEKISV
jgi:hypothetical protein